MDWKERLRNIDKRLDSSFTHIDNALSKEKIEEHKALISHVYGKAGTTIKGLDAVGDKYADKVTRFTYQHRFMDGLTRNPRIVLFLVILIATAPYIVFGMNVLKSMRGDMEVYLPPGNDISNILMEVREDWSTDIVIVYIETKVNPLTERHYEITDRDVLLTMSAFEGDDEHPEGINKFRGDSGENDSIVYVLSITTIIKETNSSQARLVKAIQDQWGITPRNLTSQANYTIPSQADIDRYISQMDEESKNRLIRDTNDDGINDSAVILLGIKKGVRPPDIINIVEKHISKNKNQYVKFTNTGPLPVIQKIQERTLSEFMKVMLLIPLFIMFALYFFHRTWQVLFVALLPVTLALMTTFGILGLIHKSIVITPQVVLAAPMLIALGVSYGLYIANRFVEEKRGDELERVTRATQAMHRAILLSALTTGFGFSSLMFGTLPPIFTLGLTLTIGIILTYGYTMLLTPAIVLITKYKKKHELKGWRHFAPFPQEHRKKIIVVALVLIIFSLVTIPSIEFNADYLAMAPQDEPTIIKMNEYSKNFEAGQTGMVIVRGFPYDPNRSNEYVGSMMDMDVLEEVDRMEGEMGKIENVRALGITDVMKMIRTTEEIKIGPGPLPPVPANVSFWDILTRMPESKMRKDLVEVFYNTLTPEMRYMLVNKDYSKLIVYVDIPTLPIEPTKKAVDEVNLVIDKFSSGKSTSYLTGVAALSVEVNDLLISSQLQSLLASIVLCTLVLTLVFRSPVIGIFTMIPVIIVVSLEPLTLVLLNIPLSVVTVMIGSIAIGTGVDFSIQITQRVRIGGMNKESIRDAVELGGVSFVEATTTMLVGLSAILFVPIGSIREFILMTMLLLSYNAVIALLVLPAIYTMWLNWRTAKTSTHVTH